MWQNSKTSHYQRWGCNHRSWRSWRSDKFTDPAISACIASSSTNFLVLSAQPHLKSHGWNFLHSSKSSHCIGAVRVQAEKTQNQGLELAVCIPHFTPLSLEWNMGLTQKLSSPVQLSNWTLLHTTVQFSWYDDFTKSCDGKWWRWMIIHDDDKGCCCWQITTTPLYFALPCRISHVGLFYRQPCFPRALQHAHSMGYRYWDLSNTDIQHINPIIMNKLHCQDHSKNITDG